MQWHRHSRAVLDVEMWVNRLKQAHMELYMLHTDPAYHTLGGTDC